MYAITVNGQRIVTSRNERLLTFLREQLRLTSVKNGCSQGACGSCTVLLDGAPKKACLLTTETASGHEVLTCEGLSERERSVYAFAFSKAGAVQCGFCLPGMVLSAKALLGQNPDPSGGQIRAAIRQNLCRCTGYQKIVDGIRIAAKMFRENLPVVPEKDRCEAGASAARIDAAEKILGDLKFVDDLTVPGMIYGGAVRSAHPRARIRKIDCTRAKALPGVLCAMTAADLPGDKHTGHQTIDWDVLVEVGGVTHYQGDALALIAAETPEILEAAKKLVAVEYEVLPPVTCPEEALAEGAPLLHPSGNILTEQRIRHGDADAAIAASAHAVTRTYRTPPSEHAFLEPEAALAVPDGEHLILYCAGQGIYHARRECARILGVAEESITVVGCPVGGGFGGKEDVTVQHHASLLAKQTGRAVKVVFSRAESMLVHAKRHPMELTFTTACDENGLLTAVKARIVADTGAYASLGFPLIQRCCTMAPGPYRVKNVDITGLSVYTNNPPGGAYRGFGAAQSCFAAESNLNLLAKECGISPWEIRYRNALLPGDTLYNGQTVDSSAAIRETLLAVREVYERSPHAGIACAIKNSGLGVGAPDYGRMSILIRNGIAEIHCAAGLIGQGAETALRQMVGTASGLPSRLLVWALPDTDTAPPTGDATASRQTVVVGEAARRAGEALRKRLDEAAPGRPAEEQLRAIEGEQIEGVYLAETDRLGTAKEHPVHHVAYSYATQVAVLGDDGRVERIAAAHDVGRAINPASVEGQIEGGVAMSFGFALTERYEVKNCIPPTRFGSVRIPRATDLPQIEPILVEQSELILALGAKGIGEIASIPTAAALAGAYESLDGIHRDSLPLRKTPYTRDLEKR